MAALKKTEHEVETPLERIFQCVQAKVLDFFLENRGIVVSQESIQNNLSVKPDELENALQILVNEKLIYEQNGNYSFIRNGRVDGFFEYFRATIDSNLENYEYSTQQ